MKPPYTITQRIIDHISRISELVGELNATHLIPSSPKLRRQNRIKTIHSSLSIEGNTLDLDQITAIINQQPVLGPKKDVLEVKNAISIYENLSRLEFSSIDSFLEAHKVLMNGLVDRPGEFRRKGVGIVKGDQVQHLAPPHHNVRALMLDLFKYLKECNEIALIKACVFHYEVEFIHPFEDGNGRMGRLWQTVILSFAYPLFQFIPVESLVSNDQQGYYKVLADCDKAGNSTAFIEYMLSKLRDSLQEVKDSSRAIQLSAEERLEHFCSVASGTFKRKDYMDVFKQLSSAAASRDLNLGVKNGLFVKHGDKRNTTYSLVDKK